jgi:16S rRNA (guanine966-N2)-methyltransferase
VREAIFSSVFSLLGDLHGLDALDLYAGSGALGLEALSRGVAHCTFVESDSRAAAVIRGNVASLGAPSGVATIVQASIERLAPSALGDAPVSLLLADPPYRIDASEFSQVLEALASKGVLATGALVVYEHTVETVTVWPQGFAPRAHRRYGDTAVSFATYEG